MLQQKGSHFDFSKSFLHLALTRMKRFLHAQATRTTKSINKKKKPKTFHFIKRFFINIYLGLISFITHHTKHTSYIVTSKGQEQSSGKL